MSSTTPTSTAPPTDPSTSKPPQVGSKRNASNRDNSRPYKKQQTTSSDPIIALLQSYSDEYERLYNAGEDAYKLSRDITRESKKVISSLHRFQGNNHQVLSQAENALKKIVSTQIAQLKQIFAKYEAGAEYTYFLFHRKFSFGLEEFMEAMSMWHYMQHGTLITREQVEEFAGFHIDMHDYVQGVSDLSGELMRYATARMARGDKETCFQITAFLQQMHRNYTLLSPGQTLSKKEMESFSFKLRAFLQSTMKCEKLCAELVAREAEKVESSA